MTKKESAEKIVEQDGSCSGVFCCDCAIHKGCADITGYASHEDAHPEALSLAQAYLNSLEFELPPGHPGADEKPTTEETEHPSELEIQKRAGKLVDIATAEEPHRHFTFSDGNAARAMVKDSLSVELLWDIRELLKKDLRKC